MILDAVNAVSFIDTQLQYTVYSFDFVFIARYHDMPDVLDFLILRQTYDQSISRNWRPGGLGGYIFFTTPEFNPKLFNLDMVVDVVLMVL